MSIAELSIIAKLWNQAKCLATEDGQRNIYKYNDQFLAKTKDELMSF